MEGAVIPVLYFGDQVEIKAVSVLTRLLRSLGSLHSFHLLNG